jgi:phosphatidate cytidylyltransferase
MLRQRVITALVLVALLLASLMSASRWPFALLTLSLMAAGGWEWARLNQLAPAASLAMGAAVALAGLLSVWAGWVDSAPSGLWLAATAIWLVAGAIALQRGPASWKHLPRSGRLGLGLIAIWLAWLAIAHARVIGINFMLSVLCLVWMADVAAYFGGKAFGRRKLAVSISPGKSWEGVWSGMAGVLLLSLFWVWLDRHAPVDGPSLYTRLYSAVGLTAMAPALLALCGLSVVGDLIESLVKRAAGAKDSSQLLPGHGGVLDRVDALLPVLPAALALISLGAQP